MDKTKKHKFKKEKLYKIIWITGLYVILIIILWLVIEYKVKWESADLNRYVRFYNCSGSLCTTEENITTEQLKDMFATKYPQYLQDNFKTEPLLQGRTRGVMVAPTDTWNDNTDTLSLTGGFGIINT